MHYPSKIINSLNLYDPFIFGISRIYKLIKGLCVTCSKRAEIGKGKIATKIYLETGICVDCQNYYRHLGGIN